jgi:hypothetical protein
MTERSPDLTRHDLVSAFVATRRFAAAHADLRRYWASRYSALSAAFGVDLAREPEARPMGNIGQPRWYAEWQEGLSNTDPHKGRAWHEVAAVGSLRDPVFGGDLFLLFNAVVTELTDHRPESPFSGFLYTPMPVTVFQSRYESTIEQEIAALNTTLMELLCDLTGAVWGLSHDATVPAGEVHRLGHDPAHPPPEPSEYR